MTPRERQERDVTPDPVDVIDGPSWRPGPKDPSSPVSSGADLGGLPDAPLPGGIDNGQDEGESTPIDRG